MTIPITVFTGFLGAGKTTLILSLLPNLPQGYRACLLKNEFGDVEVDSQLARQSSLAAVSEILNGCMCCVLVGQMKTALLEIRDKFSPDRIFIETSGSAFPAALAFQIRELERETNYDFKLDAIITVIDAENFAGYEDTSPTARMQASYSDLILVNKWEHISERCLDIVMDHLHTLNDSTPKVKCDSRSGIDLGLLFGLDTKLFSGPVPQSLDGAHNDEIQTVTIWRGLWDHSQTRTCCDSIGHAHEQGHSDAPAKAFPVLTADLLASALGGLRKDSVWRVKGFVRIAVPTPRLLIVNWAFGRVDVTPASSSIEILDGDVKLTVMGERGEVKQAASKFAKALGAELR